jgi:hypothetical protein
MGGSCYDLSARVAVHGGSHRLLARRGAGSAFCAFCAFFAIMSDVAVARQPPPSQTPAAPGLATASIAGRVIDATNGQPIVGGVLVLRALITREQQVVSTNDSGEFAIVDLPAAPYVLHVSAVGYVGRQYGQRQTLDEGVEIELQSGETRRQVDVALFPAGTITGRVTTEDGQPLAFAEIEALRPHLEGDIRDLQPIGLAESNARGEFRIVGLPPGYYYVAAIDPTDEGTTDAAGRIHWSQTFYPGTTTAAAASRVRLASGETLTGVDFPLLDMSRVTVRGRLINPDDGELATGSVIMSPESEEGLALGMAQAAIVRPDGTFEFSNVSPGGYRLRASARTVLPGPTLFASFRLEVQDADVGNALLFLSQGANLFGQVEIADGTTNLEPVRTDLWVSAPMADGSTGSGLTRSQVLEDGTLSLATPEGTRVIRLERLPEPWSLDMVLYQGRNVIDVPFELRSGDERERIRLILTDRTSRLVGVVQDEDGNVITDRAVVALPLNSAFWRVGSRHVRLTYPDLSGRYEIVGLPAGVYLVAPVAGIDASDLYGPVVFEEIASAGTEALIEAGETTTLDLVQALGTDRPPN